jgi:hypothetical protein
MACFIDRPQRILRPTCLKRGFSQSLVIALLAFIFISLSPLASAADCERKTILPPPEIGEPSNLEGLKQQLRYYHCLGAYNRDIDRVIDEASSFIEKRVATGGKLAIVFDIDETSLSNWDEISANDFGFIPHALCELNPKNNLPTSPCGFDSWQRLAIAKPIEQTLKLFNLAKAKNIAVFFITGRVECVDSQKCGDQPGELTSRQDTEKNLRQAGYSDWTDLILKPDKRVKDESVQKFKTNSRKEIETRGYRIIANVGDQYSDLNGGSAERVFKLPNPFYFIE